MSSSHKDKFQELSDNLSILVEDLNLYKQQQEQKEKIEKDLEKMNLIAQSIDGEVYKSFEGLRENILSFFKGLKDLDKVMIKCVELKNNLWEL
jgi:hypothetical protein